MLVVGILHTIGGDSEGLDAHIETHSGSDGGQRIYLHIGTAQSDKIFSAGIPGYRGREDAPFNLFGDAALYLAQLWELHAVIEYLDIAICLVALMPVSLAFKPRKSYMSTAIDTVKEILIRPIQMP